jgi:hypothetical protein
MKPASIAITVSAFVALGGTAVYFLISTGDAPAGPAKIIPEVPPPRPVAEDIRQNRPAKTVVSTDSKAWKATLASFKEDYEKFDTDQLKNLVDAIPPEETGALVELLNFMPLGNNYSKIKQRALQKLAIAGPSILVKMGHDAGREQKLEIYSTLFAAIPVTKLAPLLKDEAAHFPAKFEQYLASAVSTKSRAQYFCDNPDALKGLPTPVVAKISSGVLSTMMREGVDGANKLQRLFEQLGTSEVAELGRVRLEEAYVIYKGTMLSFKPAGVQQEMAKVDASKLDSSIKSPLKASMLLVWSEIELEKASKWFREQPEKDKAAIVESVKKMSPAAPLLSKVIN